MRLKSKIFIIFMLFAAAILFSLWIFQSVLLEGFYKQIKTQSIKNTADLISNYIELFEETNVESVAESVSEIASKNEISIKVIDTTSSNSSDFFNPVFSVVSDHDNILSMIRDSELYLIYEKAEENGGELTQHYQRGSYITLINTNNPSDKTFEKPENDFPEFKAPLREFLPRKSIKYGKPSFFTKGVMQEILYAKIAQSSNGHQYLLLFDCVVTPINSTVKALEFLLFIQSVFFIIIAALAATILAKRVAKPIADITDSAKHLAAGNLKTRFDGKGYREIAELSDTLNFAANELEKSDSIKKELIANTSHDLRTPLTMISGYAEIMRDIPGENTPENVQAIIDEASRLTTLVNDMLELSKMQDGHVLQQEEFDITELSEEIIERIKKLTEKDGFEFEFEHQENVKVFADKTKITQVIYNFLSNAVNYSEQIKKVFVKQTVSNKKVRLEFTDYGKGIPKEELPNIWERYYKIDKSHKRANVGSGIGLSIVKSVLELHKAKYGVISNLQKGSTFWFELDI